MWGKQMTKNKKLLAGLVVFAVITIFGAYNLMAAGAAEPGSDEDPLITLSYLNQQISKLKTELSQKIASLETELSSVKKELSEAKAQIDSLKAGSSSGNSGSSGSSGNSGNSGSSGTGGTTQPQNPPAGGEQPSNLGYGYVTATSLNVRSGAGTNFSVIGSLLYNTKVTLLSQSGDWYKIQYGNTTGWVLGTYIRK